MTPGSEVILRLTWHMVVGVFVLLGAWCVASVISPSVATEYRYRIRCVDGAQHPAFDSGIVDQVSGDSPINVRDGDGPWFSHYPAPGATCKRETLPVLPLTPRADPVKE